MSTLTGHALLEVLLTLEDIFQVKNFVATILNYSGK